MSELSALIAEAANRGATGVRWTQLKKSVVVKAVASRQLSRRRALALFQLSAEEFRSWEESYKAHGIAGLRTTRVQYYRGQERW
jgi:hypothetical protein